MRRTIFVALAIVATSAWAHKDRLLSLTAAGEVPELPTAYRQTRIHIVFAQPEPGALKQFKFVSSGRETDLRSCLLKRVPMGTLSHVKLTGSWYHDETTLPPYVNISFTKEPLHGQRGSIDLLFSLKDGSLLKVTEVVPVSSTELQYRTVNLKDGCPTEP